MGYIKFAMQKFLICKFFGKGGQPNAIMPNRQTKSSKKQSEGVRFC